MQRFERIQDRAAGRWPAMLPALGIDRRHLTGKHGPCPLCKEGTDRFRFDDKGGSGSYFCNRCGPGSGVDLVMKANGWDFATARRAIEQHLPTAAVSLRRANEARTDTTETMIATFRQGMPMDGRDPVSRYLANRAITITGDIPSLRFHPRAIYRHDDKTRTTHPALMAMFCSPDKSEWILHRTYLDDQGRKADVPSERKFWPGKVPHGGAVRLAPAAETMGIATGIETALSAMQLFEVPVWAALNDGNLAKWQPPSGAKCILIFGDHDESYAGQSAAYGLAHSLTAKGYHVEVRIPGLPGDWNDELVALRGQP
jgi:putative DNA primase/helicase